MLMLVIVIVNLTADYTEKKDGEMERRASGRPSKALALQRKISVAIRSRKGPAQLRGEQASDTLYI
ncbi:MAG: hypothetical protein QOG67_1088 [Verrucomicrobiota bacterium]|jgi:hypothetical protein